MVRPVPIPNTAVKHSLADGSGCIASARVGCRQSLFKKAETHLVSAFLLAWVTSPQPFSVGSAWDDAPQSNRAFPGRRRCQPIQPELSPGSSKPATCGRFKTSHPEVVEFISVLVVASSAFASRPASNRQSRDQPGLVAAGLCQRLAAASDFIPSRLCRLRPTAGSTSCSCCFAPPSMSL